MQNRTGLITGLHACIIWKC